MVTHEQYFSLAFGQHSYVSFIHDHEFTTTKPQKTETDQTICTHAYFFHVLPQREHDVSITKTNVLIEFKETIAIYYDNNASFRPHCGTGVDSEMSTRNISWGVKAAGA